MIDTKSLKLNSILNELNSFVVAFSGGVDSSFLLHRAQTVRKSGIIAVTIRTPYIPSREIEEAIEFTKTYSIKHKILDIAFPEMIITNPIERCYLCKKALFTDLIAFAKDNNYKYIIDGTNADDTGDFRPGMKALKEMGIRSPLLEAGLTKKEIRELSRLEDLNIWDKPAMACLLTRIPYDTEVKEGTLRMIEQAENILFDKGYPGTRVRVHGDVARIECLPGYIEKIIHNPEREHIITNLKNIGFRYVSLDLEGYRTGSSNPERKNYETHMIDPDHKHE
ncbi:MAG: ATP-dependent sacrificial sulfur transferase LarE [Bacteroidia bacterium]|nr:ATP-dependent sacrificial sulfur transferase LarE [Bacteroidia bacterium]